MNNILAAGLLRQKCEKDRSRAKEFEISYLDEKHLPLVMKLQEVILQDLSRPDLLQSFSYDFMKRHMGPKGVVLGVFVDKRLVAFRNVYFPDPWEAEWNLGLDLGLPEKELAYVANLQMVCVHPSFRGNSLALKLNQTSLGLLREKGTHHHICATVSPFNIWNIPVLLASGFRIAKLKNKYGGKIRYVVHQDLRQSLHFSDRSAVQVRLDNLEAQQQLLAAGFYGVALSKRGNAAPHNPVGEYDLTLKTPAREQAALFDLAMPDWWSWPLETNNMRALDANSPGNAR